MSVKLPVLPLRDIVVLPNQQIPLYVGRDKSLEAIDEALTNYNKEILLFAQVDKDVLEPSEDDLYETGVLAKVVNHVEMEDGTKKVLVDIRQRVILENLEDHYYHLKLIRLWVVSQARNQR